MDGLLTAVKTTTRDSTNALEATSESQHTIPSDQSSKTSLIGQDATPSPAHIRNILDSKPDYAQITEVLNLLDPAEEHTRPKGFDIRISSPATAQILQVLISTTIPDHWDVLNTDSREGRRNRNSKLKAALLRSLSSAAGLSSILTQLRLLTAASRSNTKGPHNNAHIQALISVLSALLKPVDFILRLHTDIFMLCDRATQKQVTWRELVSLLAGSRVLSTAAEALPLIEGQNCSFESIQWVGNGSQYASWLGENINCMVSRISKDNQPAWGSAAFLTGRALSLGYTGNSDRFLFFNDKRKCLNMESTEFL